MIMIHIQYDPKETCTLKRNLQSYYCKASRYLLDLHTLTSWGQNKIRDALILCLIYCDDFLRVCLHLPAFRIKHSNWLWSKEWKYTKMDLLCNFVCSTISDLYTDCGDSGLIVKDFWCLTTWGNKICEWIHLKAVKFLAKWPESLTLF